MTSALYTRSSADASPHNTASLADTSLQHSRADSRPQHSQSRADISPYSQHSRTGPVNGRLPLGGSTSSQSRLQAALGAPSSPNRSSSRASSEAGDCGASQSGSQQHSPAVRSPRDQHFPHTDRSPTHMSSSGVTHQYSSSARNIPSGHMSSSKNHPSLFPSGQLSPILKDRSTGGECALKDIRTRQTKQTAECSTASSGSSVSAATGDAKSEGTSINMTQLFSIATECGGAVSLGNLSELPQVPALYHESSPDEVSPSTSEPQEQQQPLVPETSTDATITEEPIDLIDTINKQEREEALISEPSTNEYFGSLQIGTSVEPPPGFNQFTARTRSEIFPQSNELLDMPLSTDSTAAFPPLSSASMNGGFHAMTTTLASSTGYSGNYGYNNTSSVPFSSSSFCLEPQVTAVSSNSDASFLSSSVTSRLLPSSFNTASTSLGSGASHSYPQFPMMSSSGINNHISSPNGTSHLPSPPVMGLNGPLPPYSSAVTTSLSNTSSHMHLTSPPPSVQMGTPFSSAGGLHHSFPGPRLLNTVVAPPPGLLPPQTMSPAVQLAPPHQLSGYQKMFNGEVGDNLSTFCTEGPHQFFDPRAPSSQTQNQAVPQHPYCQPNQLVRGPDIIVPIPTPMGGLSLPVSSGGNAVGGLYSTSGGGYSTATDGSQYGASTDTFLGNARVGLGMGQLSKQSSIDSSVGGQQQQAHRHPATAMLPHHHQFTTLAALADPVSPAAHLQQPQQMMQAMPQHQYQQMPQQLQQQFQMQQQMGQYQLMPAMQLQQMAIRQPQQISLQQPNLQLSGMQQQQALQQSNIRHQQAQQGSVFVPTSFPQTPQPQQMDLQQLMPQQQHVYFINGSADMDPNQFFAAS